MNAATRSRPVEVTIMGQSYMLACPVGQEAPFQAAIQKIDDQMCRIRDAGKIKARERIAVLAALNVAFDAELMAGRPTDEHVAPSGSSAQPVAASSGDEAILRALVDKIEHVLSQDDHLL